LPTETQGHVVVEAHPTEIGSAEPSDRCQKAYVPASSEPAAHGQRAISYPILSTDAVAGLEAKIVAATVVPNITVLGICPVVRQS